MYIVLSQMLCTQLQGYHLTEYEVLVFVPCLIEKAGHNQVIAVVPWLLCHANHGSC